MLNRLLGNSARITRPRLFPENVADADSARRTAGTKRRDAAAYLFAALATMLSPETS